MSDIHKEEKPQVLRDFLTYIETIKGKSAKTATEYYLDLRMFFRYMKQSRGLVAREMEFNQISILDIDIGFIKTITLSDAYNFLTYTAKDRMKQQNSPYSEKGLMASTRARKISSLRSFFRYLTDKAQLLQINPVQNLDSPTIKKSLPKYLSLDESQRLLESIEGKYQTRDYCMLLLFLSCGFRVAELVGLNLGDIREGQVRILGKGNKERMVYLSEVCLEAIEEYLKERQKPKPEAERALFISRNGNRISPQTVKWLVKKYLSMAGLGGETYSAHKLRHTAATLMYKNGVDIRTLQTVLGHKSVDTTMIYTHIDNADMHQAAKLNPISNVRRKKDKEN